MSARTRPLAALAALVVIAAACPRGGTPGTDGGTEGDGGGGGGGEAVSADDIIDLGDLAVADTDASAVAAQLGDPATLRQLALDQGEQVRGDVVAVLRHLRDAGEGAPDVTGTNALGQPYGQWDSVVDGVNVRLIAIRTAENRVRYVLQGEQADATYLPLMTGVFVKSGPRKGGARFHLSLTRTSDTFEQPNTDGSLHVLIANHSDTLRARRVRYRNVVDRAEPDAPPKNFSADLLRQVGVGGRYRSAAFADFAPEIAGQELVALRAAWKIGVGGRADVLVASLGEPGPSDNVLVGRGHECWDAAGLRTAYADTIAANDATDPNEGDATSCAGLAQSDPEPAVADPDGTDADAEVDELLEESGANDVTEDEANEEDVPPSDDV